ncbi:MAG: uridine kinase [Bacteroidetes bacterium]|nr:uridine kinase [Bacteroidota bacterium]
MPYIVGMAGGSASGKSQFLKALKLHMGSQVAIISLDDYYKPLAQQEKDQNGQVNFDLPTAIDRQRFASDVEKLISGNSIELIEYTFNNKTNPVGTHKIIEPADVIVIEGLFVFYFEEISHYFNLSVFIDADENVRWKRRLHRDTTERGIEEWLVAYQWNNHVVPAYHEFLAPIKNKADMLVNNNISFNKPLQILVTYLNAVKQQLA